MDKDLEGIEVVGLGQACVDYLGRLDSYPEEDAKAELEELHMRCGGPASTALVTLSRLGVATSFLGSLSDDPFGTEIIGNLEKERVDISCLKVTPGHDFNDFEIGKRHSLPIINILRKDGTFQEVDTLSYEAGFLEVGNHFFADLYPYYHDEGSDEKGGR